MLVIKCNRDWSFYLVVLCSSIGIGSSTWIRLDLSLVLSAYNFLIYSVQWILSCLQINLKEKYPLLMIILISLLYKNEWFGIRINSPGNTLQLKLVDCTLPSAFSQLSEGLPQSSPTNWRRLLQRWKCSPSSMAFGLPSCTFRCHILRASYGILLRMDLDPNSGTLPL